MGFIKSLHCWICYIGKGLQPIVLLGLRVLFGYAFFQAGLIKLQDMTPVITGFQSLGIPWPIASAYLVAIVECVGGLCLLFGFAARFAAVPLTITMIVAYYLAHFDGVKALLHNPQAFVAEAPFNYLVTALLVWAFGPGLFSIDALICRCCCKKNK